MTELTAHRLRELVDYDPVTGLFTRRVQSSNRVRVGSVAGSIHRDSGYVFICVDGKRYRAHRLAWLYTGGKWPEHHIDHINGNTSDNRWSNLRLATNAENMRNTAAYRNNTSGYKGVHFHKPSGRWRADVMHEGRSVSAGYHATPEAAHTAACGLRQRLHGAFANNGEFVCH